MKQPYREELPHEARPNRTVSNLSSGIDEASLLQQRDEKSVGDAPCACHGLEGGEDR